MQSDKVLESLAPNITVDGKPLETAQDVFNLLRGALSKGYEYVATLSPGEDAQGMEPMEWISVKERLPELIPCGADTAYSEAVIVWTSGRKAMMAVWEGIDFLCAADYWEAQGEDITHWMPLPEPPKEAHHA